MVHFNADVFRHGNTHEWVKVFYRHLKDSGQIYRRADPNDQTLTMVPNNGGAPRRIVTQQHFACALPTLIDIVRGDPGSRRGLYPAYLTQQELGMVFQSPAQDILDPIEFFMNSPGVMTGTDGEIYHISEPGQYYDWARAYYWKPASSPDIVPLEGTYHLEKCFSSVPFHKTEHRNNLIAWLLGAICLDNLRMPMLTISGNQQRIGKSVTAEACSIILTGNPPRSISPYGAEFSKQLGARFLEEERFILLDNVDIGGKALKNPELTTFVTSSSRIKSVRRLGHSSSISQSGVVFALTANNCKLSTDLATRALPIRLFQTNPGRLDISPEAYATEHRAEIYGELLAMALKKPTKMRRESSFRFGAWADFAVTRVEEALGPTDLESSVFLEDSMADFVDWAIDQKSGTEITSTELLSHINGNPEAWTGFHTAFGATSSHHRRHHIVAHVLHTAATEKEIQTSTNLRLRLETLPDQDYRKAKRYRLIHLDI